MWTDKYGIYDDEIKAGRMAPMPEYVGYTALAERLKVRVHRAEVLEDVPLYWRRVAEILSRADQLTRDKQESEHKR